jgi:outer membrane protein assembly factor BamD
MMLIAALLSLCAACATAPKNGAPQTPARSESKPPADTPAALQQHAREALAAGDAAGALESLRRLDVLFPNDQRTVSARMETVFAYHQAGDPNSAIAAAERFIRLYPDHPNLDYLYYLRGLAAFNQAVSDFAALPPAANGAPPDAPPPRAGLALQYFAELLTRYPDSRYGDDARKRIEHLRQQLARVELEAAQHSLNQGQYATAGLRARTLIDNYPDSGYATEAAAIINMAQRMLSLEGIPKATKAQAEAPSAPIHIDGLLDATWIAQQKPSAYTIQLFSTSSEQALRAFVKRQRMNDVAWFSFGAPNRTWYSLIYGVFDSVTDARVAAEKLPSSLRGEKPWIRKMSDVQALLQ